jgi:outer membrane receptor protein involved in Fe transport
MFVDATQDRESAPTGNFFQPVQVNIDNPFVTPETRQVFEAFFDPDGDGIAEIFFGKRLPELGSRNVSRNTEMNRLVVGIESDITNDWTFDLHYMVADSDALTMHSNDGSRSRFQQALLVDPLTMECLDPTGGCVPANVFGEGNISEEAADFIRSPPLAFRSNVSQTIIGSSVVGDLVELPAGELGFAFGVEFRDDEYAEIPDEAVNNDDQMGVSLGIPVVGNIELREVFAEILVPILSDKAFARYVGLEAGYRYTDHSVAGGFDTWKVSAEWEPFTGYRLRSSRQQAVRAPSALEYFEAETSGIVPFLSGDADLCSASFEPDQLGITDVCIGQGIPASQIGVYEATRFFPTVVTEGGNLDLDPEVSDTLTVGIVVQPDFLPDFQLTLDYYSIEIDNAIQFVGAFDTVRLCFAINIPNDPLCQAVMRDPVNFNISAVTGGPRNIAKLSTKGYDLQIIYEHDLPRWLTMFDDGASLSWRFLLNHSLENGAQPTPDAPFNDCAGFIGFPCDLTSFGTLPAYKTNTRVTYDSGPLVVSLQWLWIDSMEFAFFEYGLDLFGIPKDIINPSILGAPSRSYFSLSFGYEINDSFEIYAGVNNLTDTQPPLLATGQVQANTDPSVYDVFGRRYYVGLRARFWD